MTRDDRAAVAACLPGLAVRRVIGEAGRLRTRVDDLGQPVAGIVRAGPASGSRDAHAGAAIGGVEGIADGAVGSGDAGDPPCRVGCVRGRAGGIAHRRLLPRHVEGVRYSSARRISDRGHQPPMIVAIRNGVRVSIDMGGGRAVSVVRPAFACAVGIGGAAGLIAARVVIVGHMRAAVRFGGEQASLPRGVIRIRDSVAVRLGHNERTVLIVEGRGRRVRVGVGDASGVSIGVLGE